MKITITGERAEGKTRLAAIIANHLDSIGFDTSYVGHNSVTVDHFSDMKKEKLFDLDARRIIIVDNVDK